MGIAEVLGGPRFAAYLQECRESRRLVLVIVAIALLLDNMLLTTVGKSSVDCKYLPSVYFPAAGGTPLVEFSDFHGRIQLSRARKRKKKNWRATFSGARYIKVLCVFCAAGQYQLWRPPESHGLMDSSAE